MSEVMTADEVAKLLGMNRKRIYAHAERGRIPHVRLGRKLLFSRTAIMQWMGARTGDDA
jgi:excisionase family DNA binding protein